MNERDKKVGVLDTSIATENAGDVIIMDAARREIEKVCVNDQLLYFPTHEKLSSYGRGLQRKLQYNIACGTNLLHSHMLLVRQWNVGLLDVPSYAPTVLLGVGWRSQEKRQTDMYSKWLLKKLLSHQHIHSVRDSYAEKKLKEVGFEKVLNTACPTTWGLDEEHCRKIPTEKGENAIVVLTDYSRNDELDKHLMNTVINNYRTVFFWCQGGADFQYLQELGFGDQVEVIPSSLAAYKRLLSDQSLSLDYVGTRLHGGIFALQHLRRSVIVGVDHRANRMGEDINLPVISRYADKADVEKIILESFSTEVSLPVENIRLWREQFDA
jgi:polysaccharide pyruvyl transferase WcaK-like protein